MQLISGGKRNDHVQYRRPTSGPTAQSPKNGSVCRPDDQNAARKKHAGKPSHGTGQDMAFNGAISAQQQMQRKYEQMQAMSAKRSDGMAFNGAVGQQRGMQQTQEQWKGSSPNTGNQDMAFNGAIAAQQQMQQQLEVMQALRNLQNLAQQQAQELGQAYGLGGAQQANLVNQQSMSASPGMPLFNSLA